MKLCRTPNSADNFDEDDTRDSEFNQGDLAHYNWSEKLAQFPPLSEAPKFVTEARKKALHLNRMSLRLPIRAFFKAIRN